MADREAMARWAMQAFADREGFVLPEVERIEMAGRVELRATAPDGRRFGIAYEQRDNG